MGFKHRQPCRQQKLAKHILTPNGQITEEKKFEDELKIKVV
jgi:hypothetical protein